MLSWSESGTVIMPWIAQAAATSGPASSCLLYTSDHTVYVFQFVQLVYRTVMIVYFYFFQYIERRRSDMIKLVAAVAHDQVVSGRSNPPTLSLIHI